MQAFQVKGDKAEWQLIYDHLVNLPIETVSTYDDLSEALGRDFRSDRGPFYKAQRRLEEDNHRTAAPVVGVGYRIVSAVEHEDLSKKHLKRSVRQTVKAKRKLSSADRSQLTPEQARRFDAMEVNVSQLSSNLKRQAKRIDKLEGVQKATVATVEKQGTKLETQEERLARVETALKEAGFMDVRSR